MSSRVKVAAFVAALCLLSACVGAATAALGGEQSARAIISHAAPWSWELTGQQQPAYLGRARGSADLSMGTNRLIGTSNVQGASIVLSGADGNFEFEHYTGTHKSTLSGAIRIGSADGQDVVPLVVAGPPQEPVQLWTAGGHVVAKVGADGGLTIDGVELVARVNPDGRVEIDAIVNGVTQPLLVGTGSS